MDIKCPSCGAENWLENQSRCFHCSEVLRRCIDCANYDRSHRSCQSLDTDVAIKTSRFRNDKGELALDLLICDLCAEAA